MGINLPCGNKPLTTNECGGDCDEKIERLAERVSEAEEKLDTIQEGAEVNVNADWEETDPNSDAYIENKPSVNYDLSLGDSAPTVGSAVVGSAVLGSLVDIILGRGDGTEDRVSVSGTGAIQITRDGDTMTIHVPVGEIDQLRNGTDTEARAWAANVLKQWLDERIAQIPADQFLDLNKTVFANPFTWSSTTYPGSINPNLDGKPVLVLALTDGENVRYSFLNMEDLIDAYEGVAPISVNGSQISHDNSGVTAGSYGDSSNQTPNFGGTFKALRSTVDAKGHVTSMSEHTVKIPDTLATQESAGLMSAEDKEKLDNVDQLYKTTCGNPITIDDADGEVKSLNVELTPIQEGTPWIDSDVYKEPYLFKACPQLSNDYNSELLDKIVGGTVAWNQLQQKLTAPNGSVSGVTATIDSDGYLVLSGTATENGQLKPLPQRSSVPANHVLLYMADGTPDYMWGRGGFGVSNTGKYFIHKYSVAFSAVVYIQLESGHSYNSKTRFNIFDLTQMFGTTIADYIYSLEQANAGAGVAFFRKLFPKSYYAYNAGQLMSVKTSAHNTVGFNQFDKSTATDGKYVKNDGTEGVNATRGHSGFIEVVPNTTYYMKGYAGLSYYSILAYDADKNPIDSFYGGASKTDEFYTTLPSNCYYVILNYMLTQKDTLCFSVRWDGERDGDYEAYKKWTYPLDSDLELRGIPKLDASNNLYYDGDEYQSDGSVNRKYGIVDLGTLTPIVSTLVTNGATIPISDAKIWEGGSYLPNGIVLGYTAVKSNENIFTGGKEWTIRLSSNAGGILIADPSWAGKTADEIKASLNGVYYVYELATPTTETADAYNEIQICDDFGTEEFVDTRDVPIPVGHESRYADIFPISPHTAVDIEDTNGTDTQTVTVPLNDLYGGTVDVIGGQDGKTKWSMLSPITVLGLGSTNVTGEMRARISATGIKLVPVASAGAVICNALPTLSANQTYTDNEGVSCGDTSDFLYLNVRGINTKADYEQWIADNNIQLCYELATPTPITTTPTPLTLYNGDNVVSSDGDMCITYLQDRGDLTDFINEMRDCCEEVKGSLLENLVDGSAQGSLRGIDTAQEDANYTIGRDATALGNGTKASGDYSVAEGTQTEASGLHSHAEGVQTKAMQQAAHAEGAATTANALFAHSEGNATNATGRNAHAEGGGTTASEESAHAEGGSTTASAHSAHAEGGGTVASARNAHAEGSGTKAVSMSQHVGGEFNELDPTGSATTRGTYVEIIGNGTSDSSRSNARTLDWNGNEALQGGLTLGKGTTDEVTITAAQLQQLLTLI